MAYLPIILLVSVCTFAWVKGGRPEQASALLLLATWAGSDLLRRLVGPSSLGGGDQLRTTLSLLGDVTLATGLLILAIRHSSLWLGAVLMIQGGEMTMHAMFLNEESGRHAYVVVSNLLSYSFLAVILLGTLASWRRRVMRRAERVKARPVDALLSPEPAYGLSPAA